MKIVLSLFALTALFTAVSQDIHAQGEYKKLDEVKGLQIGAPAPDFTAIDADGIAFSLSDELKRGKVVLLFYRGQWCPVCNRHLKAMTDSLKMITDLGATVIAVSPETSEYAERTKAKTNANYRLLFDEGYTISQQYDVAFAPDQVSITKYSAIGAHFKESHNNDVTLLPVPATYIINKSSKIMWRHFDRDYKNRASVADIVNALK